MSLGSGTISIRRRSRLGKTYLIHLKLNEGRISEFTLSGDFFAYPAELLDEIRERAVGLEPSKFIDMIELKMKEVELAGVDKKEIIETIRELLSPYQQSLRRT